MPRRPGPIRYRLVKRGATYYVTWNESGKARRLSTGKRDYESAQRILAQHIAGSTAAPDNPTVGQLLDAYLNDKRDKVSDWVRLEIIVRHLKPHFGLLQPEHVNRGVVNNYITMRRRDGKKDGTIRNELLIFRAAFNWGKGEWVKLCPTFDTPPASQPRERWITEDEAEKLYEAAVRPHIKLFIRLALDTGARKGAILDLTWDRVSFERNLIDFRAPRLLHQNKRRVPVPMLGRTWEAMKQAFDFRRTDYVIEWAGKQVRDIDDGFDAAVGRAGLEGVTPHTLRHTAVTHMMLRGCDPYDVARWTGMSAQILDRVYAHHHPDFLGEAKRKMEK